MKLQHLSASRIKTFEQCQMQYWAQYDLGMKGDYSHPLTIMGKAYHKVFEVSTKARLIGNHDNLKDPFSLIKPAMRKYGVEAQYFDLLTELVGNAIDWGYFRRVDLCHWTEVKFDELLLDGTSVVGFIDRLDLLSGGRADIIDLKTQKRMFTNEQLENNWQADIYNWALRKIMPQVTGDVTVSFWVVRHHVQRVVRTADDAARTEIKLLEMANKIRECKALTMSPTVLCNWCLYKDECPAKNENVKQRLKRRTTK